LTDFVVLDEEFVVLVVEEGDVATFSPDVA
jgi:hypothetical protein